MIVQWRALGALSGLVVGLLAGAMIGLESAQLPQSVSILWGPWVLSTTPLTLATLLAVLWAVSYLMVRLLVALGRGSTAVAGWHSTRQLRRTERELVAH